VPLAATTQSGGNPALMYGLLVILLVAAYFMLIRPQQRRRREVEQVQRTLGPGDEVITVAGLYGTVVAIDDKSVTLEVAPGVTNRYLRQAVGQVVTPANRPDEPAAPAEAPAETKASDVVDPD